jgi:FKBP-type peptidyl-prolyl cis-trans isomerase
MWFWLTLVSLDVVAAWCVQTPSWQPIFHPWRAGAPPTMGVKIKTLVEAPSGAAKPKSGDIVLAHYTGWLKTGLGGKGKQFDSSRGGIGPFQKPPFKFALGRNRVIKAWDVGIAKMKIGETALLTCTSDVCYGKDGAGPIPANADLLFEVELLGIDGYQPSLFEK